MSAGYLGLELQIFKTTAPTFNIVPSVIKRMDIVYSCNAIIVAFVTNAIVVKHSHFIIKCCSLDTVIAIRILWESLAKQTGYLH